jgi:L-rhamnose mutarotase
MGDNMEMILKESFMERDVFVLKLKPGKEKEYKSRHDKIWPEMIEEMERSKIHNFSIWLKGDQLFGYYETEDKELARKISQDSPVIKKWNEYMSDIIMDDIDETTGKPAQVKLMFFKE